MGKHVKIDEWEKISNEAKPKIRYWLPAAAMDEEDLKQELKLLKERGFGGVEVVTLLNTTPEILKGEDGWGTDNWNEMVRVIADTTKELDMSMDLANGPSWPISMPAIENAEDPAAINELTYGVIECPADGHYEGKLPERRVKQEEGTPKLVQVMAYLEREEKILVQDSYQDLSVQVVGDEDKTMIDCRLPDVKEGERWLIFAFYSQPSVHKTGLDQYYVVDHLSKAGAKVCEDYWKPIMGKYNNYPSMESFFCDSLEYRVCFDWTPEFPEEFEKRRGYSILPYLPVIGVEKLYPEPDNPGYHFEQHEISEMINQDYLETLTQCYCENHLDSLEKMAEEFGKTIRYQVAYNKPFEGERSALHVGIPENEALGRPAMDYQKTMAAAAHLGRKKRYSFECGAEFGNAYGQNYEDLFWWVKRSLMSGMNAQVLHGASYSGAYHGKYSKEGQIPKVNWPGYEAFGKVVSNYWNRTLSVEDARGCMDTIARLNAVFLKKAKIDCAIYRESYQNTGLGSEFCFYQDDGALAKYGYSYETVSPTLLELPVCKVKNGILDKDGVGYKCLIVPEQKAVSYAFLLKVQELLEDKFKVAWIGNKPEQGLYYAEWNDERKQEKWTSLMNRVWALEEMIHVAAISEVPEALKQHKVLANVELDGTADVITAMHVDEEKKVNYYALYAYNKIKCTPEEPNPEELACSAMYQRGTTKGTYQRPGIKSQKIIPVKLKGRGQVFQCNPWNGEITPLDFVIENNYCTGKVAIEEDEMIILAVFEEERKGTELKNAEKKVEKEISVNIHSLELERFEADDIRETVFFRSHFSKDKKVIKLQKLLPWNELDPSLEKFAGRGTYFGSIHIDKIDKKRYVLRLGEVSDTFHVYINGTKAQFPDQVLKEVDITRELIEGTNEIKIIVVSNLYNCLLSDDMERTAPFKVPYIQKKYGVWETEDKKCTLFVME